MKSKSRASLFLLCALIINFITDSIACNFTVAVGKPFTFNLGVQDQNDEFVWKQKSTRRFKGKFSEVSKTHENMEATREGSLKIKSVKIENDGNHDFEVFDSKGKSKARVSITLCVREEKPKVHITCMHGKPSIICEVKDKTGLTFSWFRNGEKIEETSISLENTEKDGEYECAVEKPIPSEKSDKVKFSKTQCGGAGSGSGSGSGSQPGQSLLWGFEPWIMISILAGGGGLVLLLMIVLVICACRSCKRREKRLLDAEELRLNFNSPHSAQRSKNTARGQPAPPVPQEDPEVSNYEVDEPPPKTQPRSKKSPRPPPPPIDDDEQPPPLPQPRKNGPHGKKSQAPLYLQP